MVGWQRSIRRHSCPEDDDRNNVDKHFDDNDNDNDDDDDSDNDDHNGEVEAITGEINGADSYLSLGGRNDRRRERRGRLLPDTGR